MLILYPMHFQSKMSYFDIRKYIKSMLKEEPWESILCKNNVLNIPANRMDKLLSVLCFLQSIDLIFITVKLRQILKNIMRGKNWLLKVRILLEYGVL